MRGILCDGVVVVHMQCSVCHACVFVYMYILCDGVVAVKCNAVYGRSTFVHLTLQYLMCVCIHIYLYTYIIIIYL